MGVSKKKFREVKSWDFPRPVTYKPCNLGEHVSWDRIRNTEVTTNVLNFLGLIMAGTSVMVTVNQNAVSFLSSS